jgi:hypothetical protein
VVVWLVLAVTAGALVFFWISSQRRPAVRVQPPSKTAALADLLEVVGESFYQGNLEKVAGPKASEGADFPCLALLVFDDANPHDEKAVRVEVDGLVVGHLSRPTARVYRKAMADAGLGRGPHPCNAVIVGGWRRPGSEGSFGIKLTADA